MINQIGWSTKCNTQHDIMLRRLFTHL